MRMRSAMTTLALVIGSAVGSVAVASAITTRGQPDAGATRLEVVPEPLEPVVFEATSGREEAPFPFSVTQLDSSEFVRAAPGAVKSDGVCVGLDLADGTTVRNFCFDARTIATGLGYGLFTDAAGGATIVGIVPDAVDVVLIDGVEVPLDGNIWAVRRPNLSPAQLRIGDSSADVWVSLEAAQAQG